jgi:hypothetical protein
MFARSGGQRGPGPEQHHAVGTPVLAEGNRAELRAHAVVDDHRPGDVGGAVQSPRRRWTGHEHDLPGRPSSERERHPSSNSSLVMMWRSWSGRTMVSRARRRGERWTRGGPGRMFCSATRPARGPSRVAARFLWGQNAALAPGPQRSGNRLQLGHLEWVLLPPSREQGGSFTTLAGRRRQTRRPRASVRSSRSGPSQRRARAPWDLPGGR